MTKKKRNNSKHVYIHRAGGMTYDQLMGQVENIYREQKRAAKHRQIKGNNT